ncbi:MAG: hypothetical protein RSC21_06295 [Cetobacterium sp.]
MGVASMNLKERMSGNEAVAIAMRQIEPDVMAALLHQLKYHSIFLSM